MSRVLYVEFDDEITELVERIRASGDEADLVFVLPNRARVLQSILNLRLLQQYSRSFMKRTSIVSGDPRVQQLARDAAFPVYASVAAFERGVQALPPLSGEDGPQPPPGAPGGPPGGYGTTPPPPAVPPPPPAPAPPLASAAPPIGDQPGSGMPAPGGPHPGIAGAAAAGMATAVAAPPAVAPPGPRPAPPPPSRPASPAPRPYRPIPSPAMTSIEPLETGPTGPPQKGRRNLYIVAGAVFLVGLILLFVVAPSAKVTITLAAQPVSVDSMVIQGTPDPVASAGPDKVLTQLVNDDVTATFDAKPTGTQQIQAVAAHTQIVFSSAYTVAFCLIINKNTVLAGTGTVKFAATTQPKETCVTVDSQGNSVAGVEVPASTTGQQGAPSEAIDVTATTTGTSGNVAAGAINQVDPAANGCNPANYRNNPPQCSPSDFHVTNPAAAAGGVDPKTLTVVSDQDLTSYKAQVDTLTKQGVDKARAEIPAKAGQPNFVYAIDPGNSGFGCGSTTNPALPASAAEFKETTITVTVHCTAVLYNPSDVRQKIQDALVKKAAEQKAGGALLDSGRVIKDPQVQQSGIDGRVVFNDSGSGFVGPPVDPQALKDSFAGKGRGTVHDLVIQQYGAGTVQDVQVSQSIPWFTLPYFSSRIEVQVCVRTPQASC